MIGGAQELPVDKQAGSQKSRVYIWLALALAAATFVATVLARRRRWRQASRPQPQPPRPQAVLDLQGLTEDEAAARRLQGQDNALHFKPPYSPRQIWRANTLTIFNLSMVGLALVQVLLGKWLDALVTLGVMLLSIGLNVAQQLWARGRLQSLEPAMRPQATVVREARVRGIDPAEIVLGDILVVGPGDQILADGQLRGESQIVVDESMLTGDPQHHARQAGETVYAGSFCVTGHGAYEAQKVGSDRLVEALTGEFEALEEELTPLEQTMAGLLRLMLVVAGVLAILLLADYADLLLPFVYRDAVSSAASVIFGLAPASLFLMILVNYAMGTADLARIGALVHRTRSVESLAQATVVCFAQDGILTGVGIEMKMIDPGGEASGLAQSRIRQIVGSYARSTSLKVPALATLAATLPGSQRSVRAEAPFLSLYGWSALTFADVDLPGVYVLGDPKVLEAYLVTADTAPETVREDESPPVAWREWLTGLRRSLARTEVASPDTDPQDDQTPGPLGSGFLQSLTSRARQVLDRQEDEVHRQEADFSSVEGEGYLFAYYPQPVPLHAADGTPCLPEGLIPLCHLHYVEQVRPEVVETVHAFLQAGVAFKVFAPDQPQRIASVLKEAGLGEEGDATLRSISGPELAALGRKQIEQAAVEYTIFGQVTPEQARQVVEALHERGEAVTVVGDAVNDLAAMRQAHLSITRQSSSPAALGVADVILLDDSPRALLRVLDRGQRIANGLLDILKLYLVQISYLTLLILALWGTGQGFPYQSKQGSFVSFASIILPSVGLSFWAPAGVLPRERLGWLLARFVAPAGVTISIAGMLVYRFFLGRSGELAYAQLALTYMLVISGLVLVVLLRPPFRSGASGDRAHLGRHGGDWRPAALALVLLILVFALAQIPLMDDLFGLKPLPQPTDYLVVGLGVLAWVVATSLLWRVRPLARLWQRLAPQQSQSVTRTS